MFATKKIPSPKVKSQNRNEWFDGWILKDRSVVPYETVSDGNGGTKLLRWMKTDEHKMGYKLRELAQDFYATKNIN